MQLTVPLQPILLPQGLSPHLLTHSKPPSAPLALQGDPPYPGLTHNSVLSCWLNHSQRLLLGCCCATSALPRSSCCLTSTLPMVDLTSPSLLTHKGERREDSSQLCEPHQNCCIEEQRIYYCACPTCLRMLTAVSVTLDHVHAFTCQHCSWLTRHVGIPDMGSARAC